MFHTGTQYIFADVVLVFSTAVPFILPLDMLNVAMQHGADKYLLLGVHRCVKVAISLLLGQIHEAAY